MPSAATQVLPPENRLKKQRLSEKQLAAKLNAEAKARVQRRATRKVIFKRAEQYAKEYAARERSEIAQRRVARATGTFYVPAEPKVVFVLRIKGIMRVPPKPRKILQLLRLIQINNGVFLRMNKATANMLQLVSPYVTYGEANLKTVRELVYKRGFAKVKSQRIPLHDNSVIEEHLGKYGILCMEDIIHELVTCGPHFKQVNSFLWPFKLSNPTGGWAPRKVLNFVEGGDSGNREHFINKLVQRMN
ncbi:60S ribosomal protein L7 [Dispira simplex]|nr:60S ribosomal protein L7 [Dispira simplex]